jgi:hypothetical protein
MSHREEARPSFPPQTCDGHQIKEQAINTIPKAIFAVWTVAVLSGRAAQVNQKRQGDDQKGLMATERTPETSQWPTNQCDH